MSRCQFINKDGVLVPPRRAALASLSLSSDGEKKKTKKKDKATKEGAEDASAAADKAGSDHGEGAEGQGEEGEEEEAEEGAGEEGDKPKKARSAKHLKPKAGVRRRRPPLFSCFLVFLFSYTYNLLFDLRRKSWCKAR